MQKNRLPNFLQQIIAYLREKFYRPSDHKNLVWYLGYGSNIDTKRFLCYIRGGQPEGSETIYPGCRDKTLPRAEKRTVIHHELYFAEKSRSWQDGGISFIKNNPDRRMNTYAKMFLVTKQQHEDIAKQETKTSRLIEIDFDQAVADGRYIFKQRSLYGNSLYLGTRRGIPIFSLTKENNTTQYKAPSEQYLATIIKGIKQTFRLSDQTIAQYFITKHGVTGNYTKDELLNIVRLTGQTE